MGLMPLSAEQALAVNRTKQSVKTAAVDFSGVYTISTALNSKLVVAVAGASKANGAQIRLSSSGVTPSQRFRFIKNRDGSYEIINVNSGKALTVKGGKAKNGAAVWQRSKKTSKAQKWIIEKAPRGGKGYRISSALKTSYCLDVVGGAAKKGTEIQLFKRNGTKAQQFILKAIKKTIADGTYIIHTGTGNKVVDVADGSVKNRAKIQLWEANNSLAQRFIVLYDAKSGYYTIQNVNAGKVLQVAKSRKPVGAGVQSYTANGSNAQKWEIVKVGVDKYRILSAETGLILSATSVSAENGVPIQVNKRSNNGVQLWKFEPAQTINEGIYNIKAPSGKVLDAFADGKTEGTSVQINDTARSFSQKYQVRHAGGGYYTLECLNGGLVISQSGNNNSVVLLRNNQSDYQLWKPVVAGGNYFYFKNKASGLVLTVNEGNSAASSGVGTSEQNNSRAQKWRLTSTELVPEGLYVLPSAAASNKVIDVANGSLEDYAKVQLFDKNGTAAQAFQFSKISELYYRITNFGSGKALDVENTTVDSVTGQGRVQLFTVGDNNNKAQLWQVKYAGNGRFRIFSACGDGNSCLDISGAVYQNGTQIQVHRANGAEAQDFLLVPTSDSELVKPQDPPKPEPVKPQDPPKPDPVKPQDPPKPNPGNPEIPSGRTTYVPVDATVNNMANWQRAGNIYISDVPIQHIRDAINPSTTMADYYYPAHGFTYTGGIYQFADLRSTSGLTAAQIDQMIGNHYLGKTGKLKGLGAAFIAAAKTYGLNETYLLSHAILESGWGTSSLAMGYYYDGLTKIEGRTYPKGFYYNFYGIGAYDSSPFSGGMSMAIQNGWNTPSKAVTGAAKWIAKYYIYGSQYPQPTLYAMKWDYMRSNDSQNYGWHQYATDHLWARKIAKLMDEVYKSQKIIPNLRYIMPQYEG
jgi:beta-N-acetylglucosaminidase